MPEPFFTQEEHLLGALAAALPIVNLAESERMAELVLKIIDAAGYKIVRKS